jgi:DNA-binding beta-propeller fold protein YncE
VYVADSQNHRIQKFTAAGEFIIQWGSFGTGEGEFDWPLGIMTDPNNFVYVTEKNNHRVQKFNLDGTFVTQWGTYGSEDGNFNSPNGIAADGSGSVYVADLKNDRIQKFSDTGVFAARWGRGFSDGEFNSPEGIAADTDGFIYVADTENHRIQKFDPNGEFVGKWGAKGTGDGEFMRPNPITVGYDGFLYVADTGNDRIQKFDKNGEFILKWGGFGTGEGNFNLPYGIAADEAGFIYIADMGNHRIQKFDGSGTFIRQWGSKGISGGEFKSPYDIAAGSDAVYVADTGNNRIQKFDKDGKFLAAWGKEGSENGEFDLPYGIAVDSSEAVYVSDSGNHRIQKFTPEGEFIVLWGEEGNYPGQLKYPGGCAVSQDGEFFYVTDTHNHRILLFKKETASRLNQKALIVAGGGPYPGNHLWDATRMNANFAYRTLSYQGFTKENIFYLSFDTALDLDNNGKADDVDGEPAKEDIREALREWAADADSLVVYLVDHGGDNSFLVSGGEPLYISAADLDNCLDRFPNQVILIYDACKSGSFVSPLTASADKDRIVITSTSSHEDAYFLNQGTLSFSNFFWTSVFKGEDIRKSFKRAEKAIGNLTNLQHPLPDAGDLPKIHIGKGTLIPNDLPEIGRMPDIEISGINTARLYTPKVTDDDGIARVWAVIIPPDYTGGSSDSIVLEMPFVNLMPAGESRYEGVYEQFHIEGIWQIAFYAKDRRGNTAGPEMSRVFVSNPLKRRAVIVGGYSPSDEVQAAIGRSTNLAYNALRTQGYSDEDIYFMGNDPSLAGWDEPATIENLKQILKNEAVQKTTQDMVLYLAGSGKPEKFYLSDTEKLLAANLDKWLDNMQENIPGMITVICDGVYSHTYLPLLAPNEGKKRILISGGDTLSFSAPFWNHIRNGVNVRDGFLDSASDRNAQLEDTGNGIGNEPSDGQAAMNYTIGIGIKFLPHVSDGELCQPESADAYEPDGNSDQAAVIVINDEMSQCHNFHEPGDEDWIKFYGFSGKFYTVETGSPDINCNPVIELFDSEGNPLVFHDTPLNPTADEILDWECPADGIYYIRISHADPDAFGENTGYYLKLYELTAPFSGYIKGVLTDANSGAPIAEALIKTNAGKTAAITGAAGGYLIIHEPGTFAMTVEASGYKAISYPGVTVSEGGITVMDFALEPLFLYHSADYNPPDYKISLGELMDMIALYRAGDYHCDPDSGDGYAPGIGDQSCPPHHTDYDPPDWYISSQELLRLIEFYNTGGYHPAPGEADGFAPGKGSGRFEN